MPGIPKLQCSPEEAEALLRNQIRRGESLQHYELNSQGIADAEQGLLMWEVETNEILLAMFDTPELAEEFQRAAGLYADLGKTELDKMKMIGGRATYKNYALKAVIKHLPEYQPALKTKPTGFWYLIHPSIAGVSKSRFESEHYADCAEAAFKHINTIVKEEVRRRTGNELDGGSLMKTAFSVKNPIITIDDISTETGRNIQQGYMEIFAGSMTGIRNPKAHLLIDISPERAIHFLFLASLLMDTLDMASNSYRHQS